MLLKWAQDAIALQTHHQHRCSGLASLQLGPFIWDIASPRTHIHKTVKESLTVRGNPLTSVYFYQICRLVSAGCLLNMNTME